MNGEAIAAFAVTILEDLAPLLARAIALGDGYDPVLERQIHGMMSLVAQRYANLDLALAADDSEIDLKYPKK